MDSRLDGDVASSIEESDDDIVRSHKDNVVCAVGTAGALACGAAFYFTKAVGQPLWMATLEGGLGISFLLAAANASGDSQTWREAIRNAIRPLIDRKLFTALLVGAVGLGAYTEQQEINIRNASPVKFMDPETVFMRSSGDRFILSWEVCKGKNKGDRVDVSKYSFDKTRWHYTICPHAIPK